MRAGIAYERVNELERRHLLRRRSAHNPVPQAMTMARLSCDARRKRSFSVPIHTQREIIIPLLAFDF